MDDYAIPDDVRCWWLEDDRFEPEDWQDAVNGWNGYAIDQDDEPEASEED